MKTEDTKKIAYEIIKKYSLKKDEIETISENPHLVNDLKINSARIVDIIIDVEEKFNIEIENEYIRKLVYLNDVINLIEEKLKQKNE